ncbi:MAG: hypothetical protein KAS32_08290, partial [Candidatus Peribacteraceae bacterium]|nr:hypothetical protein [Candidatus Peribacteraceae bacterium]
AAICMKNNVDTADAGKRLIASHGQEVIDKAEKIRRMRPSDIIKALCAQTGIQLPMDVGSADWMRAAFSGSSIGTTVLGNVANKALAAVIAEPQWLAPRVAGVASHGNFHTHTVYSMATNGDLEEVPPTGEIAHMDFSAESYTRQLKTKAALLTVTRVDMINDELGGFTRNSQTLARKSMNGREKALFTAVNVTGLGSTHFTAANGNYIDGNAFSYDELGLMIKAFREQTGPDGDPVMIEPEIFLVTTTHEEFAQRMLASGGASLIATGIGSSKVLEANKNIYGGKFGGQPMVGIYLSNSNLTGYSSTATYLLANPNILPAFEVVYLNGQTSPVIEFFGLDTDPNVLGVSWRVYYDVAAGPAEFRGGVKSAGV